MGGGVYEATMDGGLLLEVNTFKAAPVVAVVSCMKQVAQPEPLLTGSSQTIHIRAH